MLSDTYPSILFSKGGKFQDCHARRDSSNVFASSYFPTQISDLEVTPWLKDIARRSAD